ncbi:MAG: DUF4760 domain-containing protein [Pseudomonadota bacterium]
MTRDRLVLGGVFVAGVTALSVMAYVQYSQSPMSLHGSLIQPRSSAPQTGWLVIGATFIAWISLLANIWLARRQSRTQHTIQLLLTTRLDREYLQFLKDYRSIAPSRRAPFTDAQMEILNAGGAQGTELAFQRATSFVLNFYEMLAAAAYREDLDIALLRKTIRGNVVHLVIQCSPYIRARREELGREKSWEHLVWLYRRFAEPSDIPDELKPDVQRPQDLRLGPEPTL